MRSFAINYHLVYIHGSQLAIDDQNLLCKNMSEFIRVKESTLIRVKESTY